MTGVVYYSIGSLTLTQDSIAGAAGAGRVIDYYRNMTALEVGTFEQALPFSSLVYGTATVENDDPQ